MAQKQSKPVVPPAKKTVVTPSGRTEKIVPAKSTINLTFDKGNYMWFMISIAVVIFGFILMSGTTDIYSSTKIVVAPLVVLTGFGLGFYAIFKKPAPKV